MQRRQFLNTLLSAAAAAQLPAIAHANRAQSAAGSWQSQFNAAVQKHPWLSGYRSAAAESFAASATLEGTLPAELRGTLYRNGPAQHEIGGFRYQHWFDGDGMLQAYRLTDKGVLHQARMIQTPKYLAEKKAGRPLYSAFGTVVENPEGISGPDSINVANISVLPHHNKLYALWEAGSPVAMDPDSLETLGMHAFSEETAGVPFSAHPRIEPDGTLWNFGYLSQSSQMVLWHIDRNGSVARTGIITVSPMSMPHDFVVTEKHLVIMIAPFFYDPKQDAPQSFLTAHKWQPDAPTRVLVINKNDLTRYQTYELPAQWVFHFGNAWEDRTGVIRFDGARADNPEVMTRTFREIMHGELIPASPSRHHLYRIDTRAGTITETPMLDAHTESEFPAIDNRVSGRRNNQLVMLTRNHREPAPYESLNAVSRYQHDTQKLQTYTYPISKMPEEHLFVPRPGAAPESEGWIVGSAFDFTSNTTELNIFDALHLDDGPICNAQLPYGLPLGLHGRFVPGHSPSTKA